jgi:hypothetical protein
MSRDRRCCRAEPDGTRSRPWSGGDSAAAAGRRHRAARRSWPEAWSPGRKRRPTDLPAGAAGSQRPLRHSLTSPVMEEFPSPRPPNRPPCRSPPTRPRTTGPSMATARRVSWNGLQPRVLCGQNARQGQSPKLRHSLLPVRFQCTGRERAAPQRSRRSRTLVSPSPPGPI